MPPPPRPSSTDPEALAALRARLQATQEAAQRLAEEAAGAGRDRPPPSGWDVPRRAGETSDELAAIVGLLTGLRDVLPDELRAQLADLVRQLLVFVRAVLDWWIERVESQAAAAQDDGGAGDVQDIPIS